MSRPLPHKPPGTRTETISLRVTPHLHFTKSQQSPQNKPKLPRNLRANPNHLTVTEDGQAAGTIEIQIYRTASKTPRVFTTASQGSATRPTKSKHNASVIVEQGKSVAAEHQSLTRSHRVSKKDSTRNRLVDKKISYAKPNHRVVPYTPVGKTRLKKHLKTP